MLFGEDYLRFKDFCVEGWFVFIKGSVEQRRFRDDPNDVEFKVKSMELLADVREKMVSRLRLQVDLQALDAEVAEAVANLIDDHPGPVGLTLEIHDVDSGLEMPSRTKRVAVSDSFVEQLEALVTKGGVQYRLETGK